MVGMAGRYTGSYVDQCSGWRAVATLADIGQASLVGRILRRSTRISAAWRQCRRRQKNQALESVPAFTRSLAIMRSGGSDPGAGTIG
jgi:hypothetical protein